MRKGKSCFVVLSRNAGSLFGYAETLNKLGYYSVSLCARVCEIIDMLEAGASFEYLVYDDFDLGKDANHLQMLGKHDAISSIIAVSDVNSEQRKKMILWAQAQRVPLRGVLQAPVRSLELYDLVQSNLLNEERFLLPWDGSRR